MTETEFGDYLIEEMESKILELEPDNIACFIAEPIMGAGGVIVPPEGYLKRTAELCKKYEILFIADEVVTAFGRLGKMIASQELFGIQPDIIVLAKGLSSGYVPLGATVISEAMHGVIAQPKAENPSFSHGFTYSGHALACATGLKNIEILERRNFCEHVQTWGPYFEQQLKSLEDLPIVGEVRGSHYMLALEYVKDKKSKASFEPKIDIGKRMYYAAKQRGLIIRPLGPLSVVSPPLTYDQDAIDETVSILRESIIQVMDGLHKEGEL